MLSSTSIQTASSLAYDLAKKGICLRAKDNTYLMPLTNSLPILTGNGLDTPIRPDVVTSIFESYLNDINKDACAAHNATQDIVIDELIKLVPKQLSFVKNQVVPAISETMETTFKVFDSLINKDPTIDFNIIEIKPQAHLFSSDIQNAAKQYANTSELKVDKEYNFIFDKCITAFNTDDGSCQIADELYESMITQYSNRALGDLDSLINKEQLRKLIESFGAGLNNSSIYESNAITAANAKLLGFMIVETLAANPSLATKCTGLSESKFNEFKVQADRFLLSGIEKFITQYAANLSNSETRTLILSVDKISKTVYVDSGIYHQYLLDGGTVESIFGLLLTDKPNYTLYMYKAMLINTAKLNDVYRQYVNMYGLYTSTELLNNFKVHFDQIVTGFIQSSPTDVEKDFYSKNTAPLENVRKILKQELAQLTTDSVKDKEAMYSTGSMIIAKSRFYFTPAFFILDTMNKAGANGNTDPSSAASIAAIYYLTDFFFTQIKY